MNVGIGLPNAVRGVDRRGIVDWARRAEAAGFASLGTIDRVVYPNYESLIALAAAAAVTERIELVTDILIAPLRPNVALFAKQAATIDSLSSGRLTLGLGVGGRADDYEVSGVDFARRGRIAEQQLGEMTAVWRGERGVGPAPRRAPGGRPGLLIGGGADVVFERAARYGDGWTMGGGTPDSFREGREKAIAAWAAAGREGSPRTMALFYFALGSDAERVASREPRGLLRLPRGLRPAGCRRRREGPRHGEAVHLRVPGRRCGRRHLLPCLSRSGRSRAAGSGALSQRTGLQPRGPGGGCPAPAAGARAGGQRQLVGSDGVPGRTAQLGAHRLAAAAVPQLHRPASLVEPAVAPLHQRHEHGEEVLAPSRSGGRAGGCGGPARGSPRARAARRPRARADERPPPAR